ncbi:MAG TPA: tetratricopeptide repeat protein [Gammaproteobacteria bacterium]|nr:tetratricopeptide repeat protein [Gammaproteobacteria bacterium]
MQPNALIFDVDENDFESRVIDASREVPVAVDFWADWCAPCRSLAPVLEKVVTSLAGQLRLAKVNTEQNQRLAGALGIRSLPTVKLFRDARLVDEFSGAYPESQLREFFSRHLDPEADAVGSQVESLLRSGETGPALALLREALAANPENNRLRLDLAAVQTEHGDYPEAEATLRELPLEKQQDERAKRLFALLHFHRLCQDSPSAEELTRTLEQNPEDLETRLKLSARRVLEQRYEAAMDQLLEIIRRNKRYRDDLARKSMLSIFELLGRDNPLVGRYRSLMATAIN